MMDTSNAKQALKQRQNTLLKKQAENDVADAQRRRFNTKMEELINVLGVGQEALQVLEDIANARRGTMKSQIENIVTEALQLVYGPDVSVELQYDVKAGRSFVNILFVKQTPAGEVKRTMDGIGGGVSDTISVPLRLLVLIASRQTDKVCILDEAYKHVDLERVEHVAKFVADISHKLGIQIIMSSHHEAMQDAADTVHTVEETNGKSKVTKTV
jgi:DNA repair exonuclease SbcCD ATPase subunit